MAVARLEHFVRMEGQTLIGWRDVPVETAGLGAAVLESMPVLAQAVVARGAGIADQAKSGRPNGHAGKQVADHRVEKSP